MQLQQQNMKIKEKIDRQKTGQSPATPFMCVNEYGQSTDRPNKRGVTFMQWKLWKGTVTV